VCIGVSANALEISQKDYITLIVSSYVHGFKEFDTTVVAFDEAVSIGIYYDLSTQDRERAYQLAKRFEEQVPFKLNQYEWGKDIKVIANVYSQDNIRPEY